nr:C-reactive protein 1.4-like [Procambarus clarkii]
MAVWWSVVVVVAAVLHTSQAAHFPSKTSSLCQENSLQKLMLNQTGYVQYVHYFTQFPRLTAFTMHYWFNLISTNRTSTSFNYGLNELSTNNNLTVQLVKEGQQFWTLQINDQLVSKVPSKFVGVGEWHHMLHSWDSATGQWSVFMDGKLLSHGFDPKSVGLVVPGGGVAVSGQHQKTAITGGMDRGEGLEGWFTLFQLSAQSIKDPTSNRAANVVASLTSKCTEDFGGDVISWRKTPRKGYGGVAETPGREVCGAF